MVVAAPSPAPGPSQPPAPAPTPSNPIITTSLHSSSPPPSKYPIDFSPPLIAMVVVVATAFLLVTYSRLISRHVIPPILRLHRRWCRRRRRSYLPSSIGDLDSPPYDSSFDLGIHVFSPYGLDESVIKTIPLSLYNSKTTPCSPNLSNPNPNHHHLSKDCAVCLIEFQNDDYVRTLPVCSHVFHEDCIDVWLRSHATCPLCRAGIFRPESPFVPLMAARIRPSLDDAVFRSVALLDPLPEVPPPLMESESEIVPCPDDRSPRRSSNFWEDYRISGGDFVLKRSHSFGFERSSASADRMMVTEPATASPWRCRRGSFWTKRPSPFGSLTKPRVFSFRSSYRGGGVAMKSPFFRRKGFFPLSESSARFSGGSGGAGTSRRSKSMTSPMFMRSSAMSSSRLRCGDPEALLSPERFNRR